MGRRGKKLSDEQGRFVEEYLKDLNATQAYRRAGYKPKSDASAQAASSRLLSNVKVSAAIHEAMAKRSERTEITQDWVLNGLKEEAEFKGEGSSHSARIRAKELLGKHLGMFPDKHIHTGGEEGEQPIKFITVTSAQPIQ